MTAELQAVVEQHEPVLEIEIAKPELAADEVCLAEGTEFERTIKLHVPRGKQYREKHRRLLSTFAELEDVINSQSRNDGRVPLKPIVEAIERLFGMKTFEDEMIPFALSMEDPEDKEYLDMLLPMEKFTAYMAAASFIVSGGSTDQVRAALKK